MRSIGGARPSWLPALLAQHATSTGTVTISPDVTTSPTPPRTKERAPVGVGRLIKLLQRRGHDWLPFVTDEKRAELEAAPAVQTQAGKLPPELYLLPSSLRMLRSLTPGQAALLRARMR